MKTWREVVKKQQKKRKENMEVWKAQAKESSQWDDGLLQALVGSLPRCKPEKLQSVLADIIEKEPADAPATEAAYDSCYVLYENVNGIHPDQFWSDCFQIVWGECLQLCAQQRTKWKFFPVLTFQPFATRLNVMISATGRNIALSDLASLEIQAKKIRESHSKLYDELDKTVANKDESILDALRELYPCELANQAEKDAPKSSDELSSDSDGFYLKYDRYGNIYGAPETRPSDSSTDTDGETLARGRTESVQKKEKLKRKSKEEKDEEEEEEKDTESEGATEETVIFPNDGKLMSRDELVQFHAQFMEKIGKEKGDNEHFANGLTIKEAMYLPTEEVMKRANEAASKTASFVSSFNDTLPGIESVVHSTQAPKTKPGAGKYATTPPATAPAGRYSEVALGYSDGKFGITEIGMVDFGSLQMPSNIDSRRKREDKIKTANIGSRSALLTPEHLNADVSVPSSSSIPSTPEQPAKLSKLSSSPLQKDEDMIPTLLQDFDVLKRRFQQMEMRNEILTKTNVEQSRQIERLIRTTPSNASRRAMPQNNSLPNLPISPIQSGTYDARERTRELIAREALGGRIQQPEAPAAERSTAPTRGQRPGRKYARGRPKRSAASRKNEVK